MLPLSDCLARVISLIRVISKRDQLACQEAGRKVSASLITEAGSKISCMQLISFRGLKGERRYGVRALEKRAHVFFSTQ